MDSGVRGGGKDSGGCSADCGIAVCSCTVKREEETRGMTFG